MLAAGRFGMKRLANAAHHARLDRKQTDTKRYYELLISNGGNPLHDDVTRRKGPVRRSGVK